MALRDHLVDMRRRLVELIGGENGVEVGHLAAFANVQGAIQALDAVRAETGAGEGADSADASSL